MLVIASICAARDCAACAASSPWKQRDDAAVFTKQEPAADADADEDGGEDMDGDGDDGGGSGGGGEEEEKAACPGPQGGAVAVGVVECLKAVAMRRSDGLPDIYKCN